MTKSSKRSGAIWMSVVGGAALAGIGLCSITLARTSSAAVTSLNVRKHPTATLSAADSASIITDASSYLSQCSVSLAQNGGIVVASGAPSTINSQADMDQACGVALKSGRTLSVARKYVVVNAINWCSGSPNAGTTFIGCSPTPGTCIVVRRWGSLEGQVLAHEFGHTKGLGHRGDSDAVMAPSIGPGHTKFNAAECTALAQAALVKNGRPTPERARAQLGSIESFVSGVYPEGILYAEASRFTASDAAKIAPWLSDPSKQALWSNVATVIGMVGGPDSIDILRAFINRPAADRVSVEEYQGRVSAIIAMGYAIRKNGSPTGRQFLEEHLNPGAWGKGWMAPYHQSVAERNVDLAAAAVIGLSRAGDATAIAKLQARLRSLGVASDNGSIVLRRAAAQGIKDATTLMNARRPAAVARKKR